MMPDVIRIFPSPPPPPLQTKEACALHKRPVSLVQVCVLLTSSATFRNYEIRQLSGTPCVFNICVWSVPGASARALLMTGMRCKSMHLPSIISTWNLQHSYKYFTIHNNCTFHFHGFISMSFRGPRQPPVQVHVTKELLTQVL